MKQETKRKIKVYSIGILIFVVGFLGAFFIQKVRYEEIINNVSSYTPEIVYRKSYNSRINKEIITPEVSYGDWFNENKNYNFNYFRAFNKKYLVPLNEYNYGLPIVRGNVKNQLLISITSILSNKNRSILENKKIENIKTINYYKSKNGFEEELKKFTNKNFVILNLNNTGQNGWIVDFETEISEKEIIDLEKNLNKDTGYEFFITYNKIILPKSFNDKGYKNLDKYFNENLRNSY